EGIGADAALVVRVAAIRRGRAVLAGVGGRAAERLPVAVGVLLLVTDDSRRDVEPAHTHGSGAGQVAIAVVDDARRHVHGCRRRRAADRQRAGVVGDGVVRELAV